MPVSVLQDQVLYSSMRSISVDTYIHDGEGEETSRQISGDDVASVRNKQNITLYHSQKVFEECDSV